MGGRFGSLFDELFAHQAADHGPAMDLYEDEHNFYARFELPGFSKKDVDVELENGVLRVRGERQSSAEEASSAYRFDRSVSVPDGVDPERISAQLKDGILTIELPKAEARKARAIDVE
jgi:HSP20 family protein